MYCIVYINTGSCCWSLPALIRTEMTLEQLQPGPVQSSDTRSLLQLQPANKYEICQPRKKTGKTLVFNVSNVLVGMKVCILQLQNSRIERIEIWRYWSEHHHYRIIASSWWMMWENIWEDLTKIFDVRLEFGAILLLVWFWLWFVPILWWTLLRYLVTVTAGLLSRIKHSRLIEQSFYTTRQADWMKLGLTG